MTRKLIWSVHEVNWLLENYAKFPAKQVANFLNKTEMAVHSKAYRHKVSSRNIAQDRFCDTYFNSMDPQRAYWLGFLFADGSIIDNTKGIRLQLAEQDADAVHRFWSDTGRNGAIYKYDARQDNWQGTVTCDVFSTPLVEKLAYYGVTPNKSYTDAAPCNIPGEFLDNFILGLLDGDGCVSLSGKYTKAVQITGTAATVQWLINVTGVGYCINSGNSYKTWGVAAHTDLINLYTQLYSDYDGFYLKRKHDKFREIYHVLTGAVCQH